MIYYNTSGGSTRERNPLTSEALIFGHVDAKDDITCWLSIVFYKNAEVIAKIKSEQMTVGQANAFALNLLRKEKLSQL